MKKISNNAFKFCCEVSNENSNIFKQELYNKFLAIANFYEVKLIESKENNLIIKLYEKYHEKVVILINKYDKPLIDNLEVTKKIEI